MEHLPRELQAKIFDCLTPVDDGVYTELAGFAASSKDSAGIVSRYLISRARVSLLHKASRIGCLPVVHEILFGLGAESVNAKDEFGNTPLHCASAGGQRHVVAHLLDHPHVDVNARNECGETPLAFMLSSHVLYDEEARRRLRPTPEWDLTATVRLLLENSAVDVNAPDADGNTPLHNASTNEKAQSVVLDLLSRGSDVNALNHRGKRPHQVAIARGAPEFTVRMLLRDPRVHKQALVETIVMLLRPLHYVFETSGLTWFDDL